LRRNPFAAMHEQLALGVFVEIALPVRVGVSMADQFVATCNAGGNQLRAVIVERCIDERTRRHLELVEQFEATPCAHPVAVFAPAVIEHIRLRRNGSERRAEPLAKSKVFDIEAQIHRKSGVSRPAKAVGIRNRPIRKAPMRCDRVAGAIARFRHVP
jgi:hypothetical protein